MVCVFIVPYHHCLVLLYRSPDGLCLLTLSSDNAFRLFNFPTTLPDSDAAFNFDAEPLTEELVSDSVYYLTNTLIL